MFRHHKFKHNKNPPNCRLFFSQKVDIFGVSQRSWLERWQNIHRSLLFIQSAVTQYFPAKSYPSQLQQVHAYKTENFYTIHQSLSSSASSINQSLLRIILSTCPAWMHFDISIQAYLSSFKPKVNLISGTLSPNQRVQYNPNPLESP